MTRAPIFFRVDGTRQQGWESFWRCLVFAAALQRRRRPTYFLSQLDPPELVNNIRRVGNEWLEADALAGTPDDLEQIIQEIRRVSPAAVIVDSPHVTREYLEALQSTGVLVVTLDHHAALDFPSRLVINPLLGPSKEAYSFAPGAQALLGRRYALVRPEIRRLRPLRAQEPAQPFRALVALGDDDPHGQSLAMVRHLMSCHKIRRVDVAVRYHHPELPTLRALAEANKDRLEIAVEAPELAARIVRCHFAITAGNSWSLELACVGVPQLIVVQNEAHWPTAQRLEEEGAATCLGWHETVSAQTIRQAVVDLLADDQERQAMSRCGRMLIDARGPDRMVTALEVMLHPSRAVQTLARAA
jgi:spore coat polysaccharide biosynthesis predicted glycosyltransferase SpsG